MAPGCYKTTDVYMYLGFQHDLRQQTTVTKVSSRDSKPHRGLSRRSNPEDAPFILDTCHCSEQGSVFKG